MSSSLDSSAAANFDVGLHSYQIIMDYKIILILIFRNIPLLDIFFSLLLLTPFIVLLANKNLHT